MNLKKLEFLFILLFLFNVSYSQKDKLVTEKLVYKNAVKYNDALTAIVSTHHIIANEGDQSAYKDSLALLYFKTNNFVSCYLVSKELLAIKPKNLQILELYAVSIQKIGNNKEAVSAYETLFNLSKNQFHGYQLALIQFELKRFGEAQTTVENTLLCKELEKFTLEFPINKEKNQRVPLKAAILNLKGIIAYQLKDTDLATKSFDDALNLFPEFDLAKQNKESIEIETKNKK